MKKVIFAFLLACMLVACGGRLSGEKPERYLPPEVMEDILWDLAIMEGIRSNSYKEPSLDAVFGRPYIYAKYGIDSLQFAENEKYYARNPKMYLIVHQKVLLRLEKMKDSLKKDSEKPKD